MQPKAWHAIFCLSLSAFALFMPQNAFAFRYAVYGDSRAPKGDPALVNRTILGFINKHMHSLKPRPDFVLFVGDAMNRSWAQDYTHNFLPDWIQFMKSDLKNIPFYMIPGNTELYGNTGWTEFPLQTEYQQTFSFLPHNGPPNYKNLSYYIKHGQGKEKSLFIILDSFGFYDQSGTLTNFDNGFDAEQIKWFAKIAKKSKANHKFVINHGPAFSVEGFPIKDSVRKIWQLMTKNNFDIYFCGHEHIFSRWLITKKVFPPASKPMTQTIVGSAGAVPDSSSKVVVDPQQAHIHSGYTFVIVDVGKNKITQRAYALVSLPNGSYRTQLVDKFTLKK